MTNTLAKIRTRKLTNENLEHYRNTSLLGFQYQVFYVFLYNTAL